MDELSPPDAAFEAWFQARGWNVFEFQRRVWAAMVQGHSGLLHATTGSGKTYAVWLGALQRVQLVELAGTRPLPEGAGWAGGALRKAGSAQALQVLWLTPMRALAADTARALQQPLADLAPHWRVGLRTGDTPAAERARQDRSLPTALVTTPESLTLLLTRERARDDFAALQVVIVDEWHELIGNKRGVQLQLALTRLRLWNPRLIVWGLSATLGNLDEALRALLGPRHAADGQLVQGRLDKPLQVDTLLPHEPGRFSWGGHLGAQMLQPVVEEIERSSTTLVFTNVRSQAETWYQLLLNARPEWAGSIALHHGSLDKAVREWVEAGLKSGSLKAVVATSSLDLGVDFLPVERVLQIGSAKGVARLLQRAGRSGHQPGRASRVTLVPTNTLELVEAVAARRAALAGRVEAREAPDAPLDVLVQHLVSMALAGGFEADAMYRELRGAWSYRALSREAFQWALDFVVHGGDSLQAYPEYHRVVLHDGRYRVTSCSIALRHRLQVGTIVADASMQVKWLSGGTLGTVEESFIARLKMGDCFVFGGRVLEYVRTQDMAAYVRKARKSRGIVPAWSGGRMPLSSELADATLQVLAGCAQGDWLDPELQSAEAMLQAQLRLSKLPTPSTLLVERFRSREGHHLFFYPFAGRLVHLGLASLLAWRFSRGAPNSFSLSVNDYGFELLAAEPPALDGLHSRALFDEADLLADVLASLNSGELAQRRFREIARVAGLVFSGYPGAPKSTRQLQASSSLFFEVFRKYDPGNRLLGQAEAEVLSQELQVGRLRAALKRMRKLRLDFVELAAPSPFSLPLMVERFREQLTTEKLADRLERILRDAQLVLDALPERPRRGSPARTRPPRS
jgi:ATP-dependent Lhr-like helicase